MAMTLDLEHLHSYQLVLTVIGVVLEGCQISEVSGAVDGAPLRHEKGIVVASVEEEFVTSPMKKGVGR